MKKKNIQNINATGFKTPDNYFDHFEDKIFERLQSPIADIKDTGFKTPENYFNLVDDKIIDALNSNDKPVIPLNVRKIFYSIGGIAAALVIMFAVFINRNNDDISTEMVETYFENRDLDSYEIAQLLSDVNLLDDTFTIEATNYQEADLEDYLLENVDIETYLE